jgi:hypothetical protein
MRFADNCSWIMTIVFQVQRRRVFEWRSLHAHHAVQIVPTPQQMVSWEWKACRRIAAVNCTIFLLSWCSECGHPSPKILVKSKQLHLWKFSRSASISCRVGRCTSYVKVSSHPRCSSKRESRAGSNQHQKLFLNHKALNYIKLAPSSCYQYLIYHTQVAASPSLFYTIRQLLSLLLNDQFVDDKLCSHCHICYEHIRHYATQAHPQPT